MNEIKINELTVGKEHSPLLIAGPCVLEDLDSAIFIAEFMAQAAKEAGFSYVFKASFDKANRTSIHSYRGPGMGKGLKMLQSIKDATHVPVISDIHTPEQAAVAAKILDCLQIPAFLCRQTDVLTEAARTGLPLNIKKGQFMAPWDMIHVVEKVKEAGGSELMLTERGTCFGYNNIVVDMRSLKIMKDMGMPVIFDATHSVQLPGGGKGCSSGQREFVPALSRAAMAAGVDGIFMEVHPDPDRALCDGPNSLPLDEAASLLKTLASIRKAVKDHGH